MDLIDDWNARSSWTAEAFLEKFGHLAVQLKKQVAEGSDAKVNQLTVKEFMAAADHQDIAFSFQDYQIYCPGWEIEPGQEINGGIFSSPLTYLRAGYIAPIYFPPYLKAEFPVYCPHAVSCVGTI